MKKRMCCSRLLFFEHLCLDICFSWHSSRTNVALSRITNLKDNYAWNAIKTDMDASEEYDRLGKDCSFILDLGLTCKSTDLSITLLNIPSLLKHAIDISGEVRFHTDDVFYRNISCCAWWKYSWHRDYP